MEKVLSQEAGREDRSPETWVRSPELTDTTALLLLLIPIFSKASLLLSAGQWRGVR